MTSKKFNKIISHLWAYREYLYFLDSFDWPFYGGLKSTMGRSSPESVDAIQNIWEDFRCRSFTSKRDFAKAYRKELLRLGETVK